MLDRRTLLLSALGAALPLRAALAAQQRIVCAGGAMTECVFALGAGNDVVAVDTTSLYPRAALSLPKIGYLRQLAVEGVLSLSPDIVLADRDAGPPNVLTQLKATGSILHQYQGPLSAEAVPDKVRFVGQVLDRAARAEEVASAISADLATLAQAVARVEKRPRVLFILGTVKGRMAGRGTIADLVIKLAGGENVAGDFDSYRAVSVEGIIGPQPDFVLTMFQSDHAPVAGEDPAQKAARELGLDILPKNKRPQVIPVDGPYLLALGPRSAHACYDLAAQLHPTQDWPGLPARSWVG
nr:ABC transporter substrate-binding protein [uncultured Dongia sp.]